MSTQVEPGPAPGADEPPVVLRWRRYGHDRLYVKGADGSDLGFWDLKTDVGHPAQPAAAVAVSEAVARWKAQQALAQDEVAATPAPPAVTGDPVQVDPPLAPGAPALAAEVLPEPWIDLSTNVPGEGVRDMAHAAHQAAPVRNTLARVLGVKTTERAWRIGADGEEKVAARLGKLARKDPRWRFLHSIPVGHRGSDIDHLAIGPGGVFTINTKHHPGAKLWVGGSTFLVDGHRQPYVRNARFEAARAADLLSDAVGRAVPVDGLIVPVNAAELVVKSQPTGVHVVPRMQIASWLARLGNVLDEDQVAAIHDQARRSTTWRR
ncbi:MAG: hypothetical protein JWR20_1751 [Marmoricola sp.]|nr:hypothetical protein [Marmoricola sp.]